MFVALVAMNFLSSCKKDDDAAPQPAVVFTIEADATDANPDDDDLDVSGSTAVTFSANIT